MIKVLVPRYPATTREQLDQIIQDKAPAFEQFDGFWVKRQPEAEFKLWEVEPNLVVNHLSELPRQYAQRLTWAGRPAQVSVLPGQCSQGLLALPSGDERH